MAGAWDKVLLGFKAPKPPEENPKDPVKVVVEKPQVRKKPAPKKAPDAKA